MAAPDSNVPFDTLKFVKRLVAAGVPREQADAEAEALAEALSQLATKRDLKDLEQRLTIKMGAMFVVAIGVIASLIKLL